MFEEFFARILRTISSYMWGEAQFQNPELWSALLWGGTPDCMGVFCVDSPSSGHLWGKTRCDVQSFSLRHLYGTHGEMPGAFALGYSVWKTNCHPLGIVSSTCGNLDIPATFPLRLDRGYFPLTPFSGSHALRFDAFCSHPIFRCVPNFFFGRSFLKGIWIGRQIVLADRLDYTLLGGGLGVFGQALSEYFCRSPFPPPRSQDWSPLQGKQCEWVHAMRLCPPIYPNFLRSFSYPVLFETQLVWLKTVSTSP